MGWEKQTSHGILCQIWETICWWMIGRDERRAYDSPEADAFGREMVSLPISPKLTEQDVEDVISAVRSIIVKGKQS